MTNKVWLVSSALLITQCVTAPACPSLADTKTVTTEAPHIVMEAYPDAMLASLRARATDVHRASAALTTTSPYYYIKEQLRWVPGSTIRVAFNGGTPAAYAQIEDAAEEWTKPGRANIHFSFKDSSGNYRHWSETDKVRQGEIRIAFYADQARGGFYSAVGQNSIDEALLGGRANEASMNLMGFENSVGDRGTVIHEFGHALGFNHEHQSPAGGCDFRLNDDAGYIPTTNAAGWFTVDPQGRRPGLYTYLGGYRNYWSREKVDFNLKPVPPSTGDMIGPYDDQSIMKYYFSDFFFAAGAKSPCYTASENEVLSKADIEGVKATYPSDLASAKAILSQLLTATEALKASRLVSATLSRSLTARAATFSKGSAFTSGQ